jgi:ketosteroid isomerase-like protein
MTETQIAQIEAEVMAFEENKLPAFMALDADRLMGLWVGGDISSVSFAERIVGLEAMRTFYEQLVASWAETRMEWMPGSVVDVIAPDLALFQGTARQATTNEDGVSYVQNVHFTDFLKKVEGEWRIQRNHVSGGVVTDE